MNSFELQYFFIKSINNNYNAALEYLKNNFPNYEEEMDIDQYPNFDEDDGISLSFISLRIKDQYKENYYRDDRFVKTLPYSTIRHKFTTRLNKECELMIDFYGEEILDNKADHPFDNNYSFKPNIDVHSFSPQLLQSIIDSIKQDPDQWDLNKLPPFIKGYLTFV